MVKIRAKPSDILQLLSPEAFGKGGVEEVQTSKVGSNSGMGVEGGRDIIRPAVERGEIKGGDASAVLEEGEEIGRKVGRALVPADELHLADGGPQRGQKVEGGGVAGVEDEGADVGEGLPEEMGQKGGVGGCGGGLGQQGVAPRGEEGQVQLSHGSEARGEHQQVSGVATEAEGAACRSLHAHPFLRHQ